jgi:hypothetical protein
MGLVPSKYFFQWDKGTKATLLQKKKDRFST